MTLLIGFDSAWTPGNSGAIAGILHESSGRLREFEGPRVVSYAQAEGVINEWQARFRPDRTIILLDQPTIVANETGQRPVESVVSPSVSLRLGGMQPASRSRVEMFGATAPVWAFLRRFGGAADPFRLVGGTQVIETYPVLALIALKWLRDGRGTAGVLPKYNPGRTKTFSYSDWNYVCELAGEFFGRQSAAGLCCWLKEAGRKTYPNKSDQDCLDACLCLVVALLLQQGCECLMVGDLATGYIVVPHEPGLLSEMSNRCMKTGRNPKDWLRVFRLAAPPSTTEIAPAVPISSRGGERARTPPAEIPEPPMASEVAWTLQKIAARLDGHCQRATYGAVAGILGVLPRGVMNGRSKSSEYSWIVAATGPGQGMPTGYSEHQIHPECLRQVRERRGRVIGRAEELREWLRRLG